MAAATAAMMPMIGPSAMFRPPMAAVSTGMTVVSVPMNESTEPTTLISGPMAATIPAIVTIVFF